MMAGYSDTSTRVEVPMEMLIKRAEPDFYRERRHQLEYEWSNGRRFYADPASRGAYGGYLVDDDGGLILTDDGATILVDEA